MYASHSDSYRNYRGYKLAAVISDKLEGARSAPAPHRRHTLTPLGGKPVVKKQKQSTDRWVAQCYHSSRAI